MIAETVAEAAILSNARTVLPQDTTGNGIQWRAVYDRRRMLTAVAWGISLRPWAGYSVEMVILLMVMIMMMITPFLMLLNKKGNYNEYNNEDNNNDILIIARSKKKQDWLYGNNIYHHQRLQRQNTNCQTDITFLSIFSKSASTQKHPFPQFSICINNILSFLKFAYTQMT